MPAVRPALAAVFAALVLSGSGGSSASAQAAAPAVLAPHRAVYDLSLDTRRAARGLDQARGRILFDTAGNRCEGFTTSFRQVVELSMNGNRLVMDVRTAHFEEGDGSGFRFTSRSSHNGAAQTETDGTATRGPDAVNVAVRRPRELTRQIDRAAIFPTEHLIRLVEAAREGRTILEVKVYDGAETGEKLYNATAIIGRRIAPGAGEVEVAARDPKLAALARWPVTISYFEDGRDSPNPAYSIAFELYENGVSRQLVIHYGEFSLRGDLASLEWQPETACTRP
ncbi:MAG: cell envelope integrity EipB family protein [Phreatobacter sp.]|uniref:cell envelope integrity EipB family protein n=1 Tax=Phreatobacter sp. TaxID=1966341 RepID=UPI0040362055